MTLFFFLFLALDSNPSAYIDKTIAATTRARTISYQVDYHGEGTVAGYFPNVNAKVDIAPRAGELGSFDDLRIQGTYRKPGGQAEALHLVITRETAWRVDETQKTIWRNPLYRVGMDNNHRRLILPLESLTYLHDAATQLTPLGTDRADGVTCLRLEGKLETGDLFRCWLGEDGFMRRLEVSREAWGGFDNGKMVLALSDLTTGQGKVNVDLPEDYAVRDYSGAYPAIGEPAPDWTLTDTKGKTWSLAELRGKVVVLDFWATWCLPCLKAIPEMQALQERYAGKNLVVLGMTWHEQGNPDMALRRKGGAYPVINGDTIGEAYNLHNSGLPLVYIIAPDGTTADFIRDAKRAPKLTDALVAKLVD